MTQTPLSAHRAPATMTCVFISEHQTGWDIYMDANGKLWSVAIDEGRQDSAYGDMAHVRRLMSNGYFSAIATEAGLEALSGYCTPLPQDYFTSVARYARLRKVSPYHHFRVCNYVPAYATPLLPGEHFKVEAAA